MAEVYDLFGNKIDDGHAESSPATSGFMGLTGKTPAKWLRELSPLLMESLTVAELKAIYADLSGQHIKGKKLELINELLVFLSFNDAQADFDAWFTGLPDYLKDLLKMLSFYEYVPAADFEQRFQVTLLVESQELYRKATIMNPELRLGMFGHSAGVFITLKPALRRIFARWLPQPEQFAVHPTEQQNPEAVWSNEEALTESIPLMLSALQDYLIDDEMEEALYRLGRKGLKKTQIKQIRAVCAQKPFPEGQKIGLDPIDLWLRFLLFFRWDNVPAPDSIQDVIKQLVTNFFDTREPTQPYNTVIPYLHSGMYEYHALVSHLSRISGKNPAPGNFWFLPGSRRHFHEVLMQIAEVRQWYAVDELLISLEMQGIDLSCFPPAVINMHRYKADAIAVQGYTLVPSSYYDYFYPIQIFKRLLIDAPILKAYCYLMAALGILEISEREPSLPVEKNDKAKPISPYEALDCVRITPFGRWCLGLDADKPELARPEFEALADRELLLVTFKGKSLERRLYLDDIGEKLGEERYRISAGSFIKNCMGERDIQERIERFYQLIEADPADHWRVFFDDIMQRAHSFSSRSDCVLFSLPDDPELRRLLSTDQKISGLIVRAEGNRIAVESRQLKKFFKLVRSAGYLPPDQ